MKRKYIFSLIFALATLGVFYFLQPSKKELCQNAFKSMKQIEYDGIVVKKYIDPNHSVPTFIIRKNNSVIEIADFRDLSGLYEYLKVRDSVVKKRDDNSVYVYRFDSRMATFKIDYGCN